MTGPEGAASQNAGRAGFERGSLIVSGMFRSGTTLLTRMLSASGECLVVTDPFVYFFKAYRNMHLADAGIRGWHPDEPTSDLFLSPQADVNQRLLGADLSEPISRETFAKFQHDVKKWKQHMHPRLCSRLREARGETFAEVYANLLELCADLYAGESTRVMGAKVTWCEEFLPALARAYPDTRFVLLVRDLRGVVASQNSRKETDAQGKRPLLFYVRQWRKSVTLTRLFERYDETLAGRVRVVRYEDLVADPETVLRELADFAGLEYSDAMLEVARFRAENERDLWTPNSSYEPGAGVYTSSVARWREVLREDEIAALDALAGPELALYGYDLPERPADPLDCLGLDCEPALDELEPWIRPYSCSTYLKEPHQRTTEYAVEGMRRDVLAGRRRVPGNVERELFLDRRVLDDLRAVWLPRLAAA